MRNPDKSAYEHLAKLVAKDDDVVAWWNQCFEDELAKLLYASTDTEFRVAQGRAQLMNEVSTLFADVLRSIRKPRG